MANKFMDKDSKKEMLRKLNKIIEEVKHDQVSSLVFITNTTQGNTQQGEAGNALELLGSLELAKKDVLSKMQAKSDAKDLLQHLFKGMTEDDDN